MDGLTLRAFALAFPQAWARAVSEAVREVVARTPAPRSLPFFGLELPVGCGSRLLDHLSDLGIFRFYERVLEIGCGVGGATRWLARRRGCRVVGLTGDLQTAIAARRLTDRAHLEAQVSIGVSQAGQLPVAPGRFTHAWSVESLHRQTDKRTALAEAFWAIRPGGHVAVQDWMLGSPWNDPRPWPLESLRDYEVVLRSVGFTDLRSMDVTDLRESPSAMGEIVERRVQEILGDPDDRQRERLAPLIRAFAELDRARESGAIRLYHLFGTRPS